MKLFRFLSGLFALCLSSVFQALWLLKTRSFFLSTFDGDGHREFLRQAHLSGYDPNLVLMLSRWEPLYSSVRHPLLSWLAWPLWKVCSLLSELVGTDVAPYVMGALLVACSVASAVLLFRIAVEHIGVRPAEGFLLVVVFFGLAYIMLSPVVADHFTFSLPLLLWILLLAARSIDSGRPMTVARQVLLFFLSAGITLSNGIKVFLAAAVSEGRAYFRWKSLTLKAVLPAVALFCFALAENAMIDEPREDAIRQERRATQEKEQRNIERMTGEKKEKALRRIARREKFHRMQAERAGKPITGEGLLRWTDVSTSRLESVASNLFGESLLFHEDHFLEDTLVRRPVFVDYRSLSTSLLELFLCLLFLCGMASGLLRRRTRPLALLLLLWFGWDMFIHLVLGFGLNEIHIMTPHWAFILPLSFAFLLASAPSASLRRTACAAVAFLAACLYAHNLPLLAAFLAA